MSELAGMKAAVHGRVQGVGFRWFTQRQGQALGLSGRVRNEPDGSVAVEAEGERRDLEQFLVLLRQGPTGSRVTDVAHAWLPHLGRWQSFEID